MEPLPLSSYGSWSAEMRELEQKLTNFKAEEAGKFYFHKPGVDTWYYCSYGGGNCRAPENKVASQMIGRKSFGDVAVVRTGPEVSNDYPEEFTRTELVNTAAFYRENSPADVFQEREKSRAYKKLRFGGGAVPRQSQSPEMASTQVKLNALVDSYGFRRN
ncbi:hypothetical protein BDW62DRAFT_183309 [Aspergillus aurantiobrunneus]